MILCGSSDSRLSGWLSKDCVQVLYEAFAASSNRIWLRLPWVGSQRIRLRALLSDERHVKAFASRCLYRVYHNAAMIASGRQLLMNGERPQADLDISPAERFETIHDENRSHIGSSKE